MAAPVSHFDRLSPFEIVRLAHIPLSCIDEDFPETFTPSTDIRLGLEDVMTQNFRPGEKLRIRSLYVLGTLTLKCCSKEKGTKAEVSCDTIVYMNSRSITCRRVALHGTRIIDLGLTRENFFKELILRLSFLQSPTSTDISFRDKCLSLIHLQKDEIFEVDRGGETGIDLIVGEDARYEIEVPPGTTVYNKVIVLGHLAFVEEKKPSSDPCELPFPQVHAKELIIAGKVTIGSESDESEPDDSARGLSLTYNTLYEAVRGPSELYHEMSKRLARSISLV